MKVIADRQIPGLEEGIRQLYPDFRTVFMEGKDISNNDLANADALIVRTRTRCDSNLLEGSNVKLIGTATIGTDHIDTEWCASNGIKVVNAPACNAPAVMQYVASALHEAGFDPKRHTLGVVGKGNIGMLITELYRNAGCNVVVCDPPRKEAGFTDEDYLELDELLSQCDAVTFHVPYTKSGKYPTHHLLSGPLPERVSIIVNASRGPVIKAQLLKEEGIHRKFIIDTWPFEEYPEDFTENERRELIEAAFIATPHIAGYSFEGKRRATEAMLATLGGKEFDYMNEVKAAAGIPLNSVISSFSPLEVSEVMKKNCNDFERLRSVNFRHEPSKL